MTIRIQWLVIVITLVVWIAMDLLFAWLHIPIDLNPLSAAGGAFAYAFTTRTR